ncbi:TniB family NTP-binding protein [Celeribacter baekdonensis]|uniref:TniB family NTP-binding protein n=1 Tax=Celeribacter baekdonensis TaxID=875171 RepID=UPI0020C7BEBB|nr:TniB family NTP-binding protein [Celeribacter baekdonensis]
MTDTTAHLTANTIALLFEPNAGRIRTIRSRRWILYPRAKQALDRRTGVLKTPVLAMEMVSRPGERRFYGELLTLLGAPQRPRTDIAQWNRRH